MRNLIKKILKEEKDLLVTSPQSLVRNLPKELKDILFKQWGAKQNPEWHPEGNTLKHILVVLRRAYHHYPDDPNMIMAALFHDLGKMDTYNINPKTGNPTAYGHENESTEYVEKFKDWIESFEGTDVEEIKYLVKNHMKVKPSTWDQMRDKKKEPISSHPAFNKLMGFTNKLDGGGTDLKEQIKKILKEEFDDFGWTKEIDPFEPGSEFENDDICFDSDDDCMVNINKDSIIFKMSYDEWSEKVDTDYDNRYYLQPVLDYGRNYDGGDDYYEFDSDEFNYSGYKINEKHKEGLQQILNLVGSQKSIKDIIDSDNMNSIEDELKYPPLKSLFDNLQSNYLSALGYQIQKNRWTILSNYIWDLLDGSGVEWETDWRDGLTITIPKEKLLEYNFKDLTQLLKKVSSVISDGYWSDSFYDEWDTSGAEEDIEYEFDRFIEKSMELLEEEGVLEKYQEFNELIDRLGFQSFNQGSYYGGYTEKFYKKTPDGNMWVIIDIDYDEKMVDLFLFEGTNIYNPPLKKFRVPYNKIGAYINNYMLDL